MNPAPAIVRCATARDLLLAARQHDGAGMFELAFEDCIEIDADAFPDPRIRDAIGHVQACPDCGHWRSSVFAPVDTARLERARHYCCNALFRAADDPDPALPIRVDRLGPEQLVYWMAGPERACIDFCPWCGTRLPRDRIPPTARARA